MTVHCSTCRYEWELPIKLPLQLEQFCARLKAFATIGCPECFADGSAVVCGPAPVKKKRAKR